jgi:membrane protein required for beta-lactamase induction
VAGKTISEWVRQVILEALETTPGELRLMAFVTAQTGAVSKALEEWQQNQNLSDANVQERIRRLAIETALDDAKATQRLLELKRKERGAAA